MYATVESLHKAHGDASRARPNVVSEELQELCLYLQERGWSGLICLREAVEAIRSEAYEFGYQDGRSDGAAGDDI